VDFLLDKGDARLDLSRVALDLQLAVRRAGVARDVDVCAALLLDQPDGGAALADDAPDKLLERTANARSRNTGETTRKASKRK
jgi:hypothetical protein